MEAYEPAELHYTAIDIAKLNLRMFFLVLRTIVLSIPEFFKLLIPKKPKSIVGQLALVTGGSNGIGKAIAISLAEQGCNIAIANRNHQEGIKTAKEIEERFGVKAKAFKADVSSSEDIKKLKVDIESSLGCVDILVNNAAYMTLKFSLLEGTDQDIQEAIDTNLSSHFWTVRAFLPGMINRKRGHIVGISSISALVTIPNAVAYSTTKAGNDNFMSSLYDDLCWQGHDDYIKLTTVFPGPIATQRKLQKMSEALSGIPMYDPKTIGYATVQAVLKNKRKIYAPSSIGIMNVFNWLPDKTSQRAKLTLAKPYNEENLRKLRNSV